jgi:hypothetical protein
VSAIATCASATTAPIITVYPAARAATTGTTRFSGAQLEVGTYPTSLIVTTSTSVVRNSDAVSATVPAVPAKWCVAVTALPEEGRSWIAGTPHIWSLGNSYNVATANAAYLSSQYFGIVNAAVAQQYIGPYTAPSIASHRMIACGAPGAMTLTIDGVTPALTVNGGTGAFGTAPTTLNIGWTGATGTPLNFGGFLKSIKLCGNAKTWKDCR